jgi:hypothetical protein
MGGQMHAAERLSEPAEPIRNSRQRIISLRRPVIKIVRLGAPSQPAKLAPGQQEHADEQTSARTQPQAQSPAQPAHYSPRPAPQAA